jgi:hypothetical protein
MFLTLIATTGNYCLGNAGLDGSTTCKNIWVKVEPVIRTQNILRLLPSSAYIRNYYCHTCLA